MSPYLVLSISSVWTFVRLPAQQMPHRSGEHIHTFRLAMFGVSEHTPAHTHSISVLLQVNLHVEWQRVRLCRCDRSSYCGWLALDFGSSVHDILEMLASGAR
jgi:hypothetical protein